MVIVQTSRTAQRAEQQAALLSKQHCSCWQNSSGQQEKTEKGKDSGMEGKAKFIWLDKERYPRFQGSPVSVFAADRKRYLFGVAAFRKEFTFDKKIRQVEIEIFGDTRYYLWINDRYAGTGPCPPGGDFDMPYQYSSTYLADVEENDIRFFVRVQLTPTVQTDNSKGKGGLILAARLIFEDGSETAIGTDETWFARLEREFLSPRYMDYTKERDDWSYAVHTESVWNVVPSPIRNLQEQVIDTREFVIPPRQTREFKVDLAKIYAAYSLLRITASGEYFIRLITAEKDNISLKEHCVKGDRNELYRSNEYYGVGEYCLLVQNKSDVELKIQSEVISVCYPSEEKGFFRCSDEMLNRIYDLGKHTVKICRQGIELDSPVHQENLLCTGDYLIESLVNNYTTGDYSLTRFDIVRMSHYLKLTDGYMYNDNYALVWILWLWDYYRYTGDELIFSETIEGLEALLFKMEHSEDSAGLVQDVSGYMFVDWTFIDGHSLFAPPRALGETVVDALYYKLLETAAEIYHILEMPEQAKFYRDKSDRFKATFHETFYDPEKGLYFDGRNGMTACNAFIPENPQTRYYTRYANTLAVLFGLAKQEDAVRIMRWVLEKENLDGVQPYFMHYILEAVYKVGLFPEYGMGLIRKWQTSVEDCEKGMHEVWYSYEGYETDYSHGWGATPTYQLPSKILGLEILEPGFRKIRLKPDLYGLKWVTIKVPTPFGTITCHYEEGSKPRISVPEGIEAV